MLYTQDIERAFDGKIGENGASKARYSALLEETKKATELLRGHKESNRWPILTIAEREDDLDEIEKTAVRIKKDFRTLVVLGIGGSSLGGKALAALVANPFESDAVRIHFVDNIDPHTADQLVAGVELATTCFLVISKSGSTAETLAQFLIVLEMLTKKLGKDAIAKHCVAITEPGDNILRRIASAHKMHILEHETGIGGRFSVLTNVGLLPACVAGVDIRAIRRGAAEVVKQALYGNESEPAKGAALSVALTERGKNLAVLMPYCDRLEIFNGWYCQVWAESIGKQGHGTTPVRALGTTDQHSQLQLYLDGPRDKFLTLIMLAHKGKGPIIPDAHYPELGYLANHPIGDLMEAEQRATAESLGKGNCPLRVFTCDTLDEKTLGALMMHFMLETMIASQLWNINAFDQPAVEEGKRLAREYLAQGK